MSHQTDKPLIILLQGPLGPFFADFADELKVMGCHVVRVTFNGGDHLYAGDVEEIPFHAGPDKWPEFLAGLVDDRKPKAIVCYGDMRVYHREAKRVADALSTAFWCFEEGYVRPGYSTFEPGGNNAQSLFPIRFRNAETGDDTVPEPYFTRPLIKSQTWFGITYYARFGLFFSGYEGYAHHRRGSWLTEQASWIWAGFRKLYHTHRDKGLTQQLIEQHSGRIILVPLQVSVDTQLLYHSDFDSMEHFINHMMQSAARHMAKEDHMVIKHHPMERGHKNYRSLITRLARQHGLVGRVTYAYDLALEDLMDHTKACITINSTVSMLTLSRGVPTLSLGRSLVTLAGLTSRTALDDFWKDPDPVDSELVGRFHRHLVAETQVPGNFYVHRKVAAFAAAKKLCSAINNHC